MDDVTALTQLVLHERRGRDRGWWDAMRSTFAPGARVHLSWIDGTAEQFVAGSRAMAADGIAATHRMDPPIVDVEGDRALVEAPAAIVVRTSIGDVEIDLVSHARLLYRARRDGDVWRFVELEAMYASDSVSPTTPGARFVIDAARLGSGRRSYRWLAYVLGEQGHPVADDLPGDDLPATVERVYAEARVWLGRAGAVA